MQGCRVAIGLSYSTEHAQTSGMASTSYPTSQNKALQGFSKNLPKNHFEPLTSFSPCARVSPRDLEP